MNTDFQNADGWPACGRSLENANLLSGFELHHAPAAELAANGGICAKCATKIRKANAGVLAGKIELPVDLNEHNRESEFEPDLVGFSEDGHRVGVVEFDFAALDGVLESAPEEARQMAGEAIRENLPYCFGNGNLTAAAAKFAVIGAGLRPDAPGLNDATQTDLAKRLGLSKAALSKASVKFQDTFGVKFGRSRSLSARSKMRARRLGGPARNHHDTKDTAP